MEQVNGVGTVIVGKGGDVVLGKIVKTGGNMVESEDDSEEAAQGSTV